MLHPECQSAKEAKAGNLQGADLIKVCFFYLKAAELQKRKLSLLALRRRHLTRTVVQARLFWFF